MIVSLVFLEDMLDAIGVIDQVSGPQKEAYPNDITVLPDHFQSQTESLCFFLPLAIPGDIPQRGAGRIDRIV